MTKIQRNKKTKVVNSIWQYKIYTMGPNGILK